MACIAGSTAAARARNRAAARASMLGQREAVLSAATDEGGGARDRSATATSCCEWPARRTRRPDIRLVDAAVAAVKASVEDALWDQIVPHRPGCNAEFPCTREQRSRCS